VVEVTGNYAGILSLDGYVSSAGAGRGIWSLPNIQSAIQVG
jgi:hypothetical protein